LSLNIRADEEIRLPRKELTQAILHLADNAFKFSKPDGNVSIDIRSTAGGGIVVDVRDEGIGIPADQREKVFERFYQISRGDTREYDGLGVGLTIARAIAESMGGGIELPEADPGCQVRMTIPGEPGEEAA